MSETSLPVLCNRLNSVIILFVGGGHPISAARFHDKEVALAMKDREADVAGGAERAEDVPAGGAPTDWMSRIDDDVALDRLAVPGTHDTMTHRCDGYTTTQSLSLVEQLDCGVRFVDIRLRRDGTIAHRYSPTGYDIDDVLGAVADFLEAHPGETVLMRLQNANEDKDDFPEYTEALAGAVREYRDLFHLPDDPARWPSLGRVRGGIVALECNPAEFDASAVDGVRWAYRWHDNLAIELQDMWDGPAVEDKLEAITALIRPVDERDHRLRLNHVSATNGAPGNPLRWARALNPRVAGVLGSWGARPQRPIPGVLIYDFVTADLAARTIALNRFGNHPR